MLYILLANGFEEIEALATVDVLRRANLAVTTVGVGNTQIVGAHSITVTADISQEELYLEDADAVVLPGGLPGTVHLEQSEVVQNALAYAAENRLLIAAICAAPSILGHKGLLKGKCATCYPGFEKELIGATVKKEAVVADGNIITGKGAGVAVDFGLEIVKALVSPQQANSLKEAMQCQ